MENFLLKGLKRENRSKKENLLLGSLKWDIWIPKAKRKNFKGPRMRQQVTLKGARCRLTSDFSTVRWMQEDKWIKNIYFFKVSKEKHIEHRILYPTKLSFKHKGTINIFLWIKYLNSCDTVTHLKTLYCLRKYSYSKRKICRVLP